MPHVCELLVLLAVARQCFVYEDCYRKVDGEKDQNPDRKVEHDENAECDHRRHGADKTSNVSQHYGYLSKLRVEDDITSRILAEFAARAGSAVGDKQPLSIVLASDYYRRVKQTSSKGKYWAKTPNHER